MDSTCPNKDLLKLANLQVFATTFRVTWHLSTVNKLLTNCAYTRIARSRTSYQVVLHLPLNSKTHSNWWVGHFYLAPVSHSTDREILLVHLSGSRLGDYSGRIHLSAKYLNLAVLFHCELAKRKKYGLPSFEASCVNPLYFGRDIFARHIRFNTLKISLVVMHKIPHSKTPLPPVILPDIGITVFSPPPHLSRLLWTPADFFAFDI